MQNRHRKPFSIPSRAGTTILISGPTWVRLIAVAGFGFCSFSVLRAAPAIALSAAYGRAAYHIDSRPYQRVQCTLIDSISLPGLEARHWTIYGPDAPDTVDQSNVFSTLDVTNHQCHVAAWSELSPLGRTLLQADLVDDATSDDAQLDTRATYTATLYRRVLVPGPAHSPVAPLSGADRKSYTRDSDTIDFDQPVFQTWLSAGGLRRRPGERDLDFALRAFDFIRANYSYNYDLDQDRRASAICQVDSTDCGGLSQLLVATLRASGVPAMALCGRIATSTDNIADHGNCHVKSEFYADGIGWVPVEMAGATCDKAAPYSAYFGKMYGHFLTLSIDNDQELVAGDAGVENQRGLQGVRFFVSGAGSGNRPMTSTTSWTVAPLPLTTVGSRLADTRE